jgi:hypothetical protein
MRVITQYMRQSIKSNPTGEMMNVLHADVCSHLSSHGRLTKSCITFSMRLGFAWSCHSRFIRHEFCRYRFVGVDAPASSNCLDGDSQPEPSGTRCRFPWPQGVQMSNNKDLKKTRPGEMPAGTHHYNPGNMSGKKIGNAERHETDVAVPVDGAELDQRKTDKKPK